MIPISAENGSRQPVFLAVTGCLLLLATTTVALRMYCRAVLVKHVGLDDWLIVAAAVFAVALFVHNVLNAHWGSGQHEADLNKYPFEYYMVPTLEYWYSFQIIYPVVLFVVKMSILALYHRLFPSKQFRMAIYVVAGFITAITLTAVFVHAFECPRHPEWAFSMKFLSPEAETECINIPAAYYAFAAINIVTDAVILGMPIPALRKLNIQRNKRNALIGVFMIGSVAVVASIVRLRALWLYDNSQDVAYDAIMIMLWSQIEIDFAIWTASVPSLRPLFKKTFASTHQNSGPISYGKRRHYGHSSYGGAATPGSSGSPGVFARSNNDKFQELYDLSDNGAERGGQSKKNHRTTVTTWTTPADDANSDEFILPRQGQREISRTVEIGITREDASAAELGPAHAR